MAKNLINSLIESGWKYEDPKQKIGFDKVDSFANGRLKNIELDFYNFIKKYNVLANEIDDIWFSSLNDFSPQKVTEDDGFLWNTFELESLEYADDEEEKKEITSFWNENLPFLFSVKNGYAFIAMVIKGDNKGKIVLGREPEYEQIEIISNSFKEFLQTYSSSMFGENKENILSDFI